MDEDDIPDELRDLLGGADVDIKVITATKDGKCNCPACQKGTISEHYGKSRKAMDKLAKDIFCDMIQYDSKIEVLDKWFPADFLKPENGGEIRCRVIAFAHAMDNMIRLQKD